MGGFSGVSDWLNKVASGSTRKIEKPGFFDAGTVGGSWGNYLKNLYATPTGESAQFKSQSMALRDALSMESDTQKDEFGLASNAGGFYDSGARMAGLTEINRNRIASYSQGLAQILAKLESDKLAAAFPFLQAQIGEYGAYQTAKSAAAGEANARKMQVGDSLTTVGSAFAGGGMGGGGGGGGYV